MAGAPDGMCALQDVVARLHAASCGSAELDRQLAAALAAARPELAETAATTGLPGRERHWSRDLNAAFSLLPRGYNFSLGDRDGVCWAWVQPNDAWEPTEYESRHDHPRGSGLVVGDTAALALTCAAVIVHIRRIEHRRRRAGQRDLHRLIYRSRLVLANAAQDTEAVLGDILRVARHNNTSDDLTGALLLFNDGCFAQVLEGGLAELARRFEVIRRDRRHCDVTLLEHAPIATRSFADWSMGFAGQLGRPEGLVLDPPEGARQILDLLNDLLRRNEAWSLSGR